MQFLSGHLSDITLDGGDTAEVVEPVFLTPQVIDSSNNRRFSFIFLFFYSNT